ncbi:MAG: hypothetical protein ACRDVF_01645 [Microbacterium sp.]|uniref:hypothetical protein n=1 Tax=Microbacterium sp. TaxID=51671 RepID=UPI003D6E33B5
MNRHTARPAVATLSLVVVLSLTACSDLSALGAPQTDAPIDAIAKPTPTETADVWHSSPVTEDPDWDGMSIGELKINGDEYSYLEVEGEEPRYLNVTVIPFEVGDIEPQIDSAKPFVVEFKSACRTAWTSDAEREPNEEGAVPPPEFSMFIAKSENADDGVPVSCTVREVGDEDRANSSAWFNDTEFSDGKYFIVTKVEGSEWRQVIPLTISTGILDKQGLGLGENGIWHDPRAAVLPGEQGEIYWWELSKVKRKSLEAVDQWWVEPKQESFFSVPEINITGSGTNADPIHGSFVALLDGEHRTTRTDAWVLGRDRDATSGPEIGCTEVEGKEDASAPTRYECDIWPFVESKGKSDVYYLILISQPGEVRQVFEVKVK